MLRVVELVHEDCVVQDALKRFYIAAVRSAVEYGAQVWNGNLTKEQVKDIERIQKRAMKIICPELD